MKWANLIPWRSKQEATQPIDRHWKSPMERLRSDFDQMLQSFWEDDWNFAPSALSTGFGWGPSVEIDEDDHQVRVRAELPGVDPKDLDLSVSGDVLTISGEKREVNERHDQGFYHSECRYGAFRRSVPLNCAVDANNVSAEFKNGVLTVNLNKREDTSRRRIPILPN